MPRYNLTDHIHYDRNAAGQKQAIYFDIEPDFAERVDTVVETVNDHIAANHITDMREALMLYAQGFEKAFGDLTLGQLLYISHNMSSRLTWESAHRSGYQEGFEKAAQARINVEIAKVRSSPSTPSWSKNDGNA